MQKIFFSSTVSLTGVTVKINKIKNGDGLLTVQRQQTFCHWVLHH